MQRSRSTGKIWHRRKHSVEIDNSVLENEFNQNVVTSIDETKDTNFQSVSDSASSPSTSLQVQNAAQFQQNMREEWAAIRIQTAFRGFLVIVAHFLRFHNNLLILLLFLLYPYLRHKGLTEPFIINLLSPSRNC